jgi:peptide/nickel transport system substrate-binding protein
MNESTRGIGRKLLYTGMVGAMALSIMPASFAQSAVAAQNCTNMNKIDVCGRFLEVWNKQGNQQNSTYVNGLPITAQRNEVSLTDGKSYSTQWFERARYEAHPENKAPYDVLLGLLGVTLTEGRGVVDPATKQVRNPADAAFVGIDKPADANGTSKVWFQETRHSVSGKILETWNKYGGLQQFGFPLSEQFKEVSTDGKTYDVQYFERNRFELHPEIADVNYQVLLGLLGVQQYKMQATAAADMPGAPPANVTSAKTEIKIGSSQEPADLTPFNNALVTSRFRSLIEDQLTRRDDNEDTFAQDAWYVPTLENGGARFIGLGADQYLQVKYKIRRGIKWSDGVELTSNDAVFAWKLIMNPDAPVVSRIEQTKMQNVDNPDKYTVIYNYRSANSAKAFLNALTAGDRANYAYLKIFADTNKPVTSITYSENDFILPEHVLGKIAPAKIPDSDIARAPIGTGPYKVDSWTTGQQMILSVNPNYTLTAAPLIKKITAKFIADVNQMLAQIQTGDIDYITSEAFVVPPANAADLQAKGLSIVNRPASTWEHVDFYMDYGPFKDHAVREAIIRGINRKRVVDTVFRGAGAVMNGSVPGGVYFSLENPNFAKNFPDVAAKWKLPIYDYDPAKASALLDGAGWVKGSDGIRVKNGERLSFEYGSTINAVRQSIQALVSADLKAIGVDAVQKAYPAGDFFDSPNPRSLGVTKFGEFAYVGSKDSDFTNFLCSEVYNVDKNSGSNENRYCNQRVDELNAIYNSSVDPAVQVPAMAEAQVLFMQDIPVVPLVQRSNIEVVSGKLKNHKETNSQVTSFWNARQWYFVP